MRIVVDSTIILEGEYNDILQEFELNYGFEFFDGIELNGSIYHLED